MKKESYVRLLCALTGISPSRQTHNVAHVQHCTPNHYKHSESEFLQLTFLFNLQNFVDYLQIYCNVGNDCFLHSLRRAATWVFEGYLGVLWCISMCLVPPQMIGHVEWLSFRKNEIISAIFQLDFLFMYRKKMSHFIS